MTPKERERYYSPEYVKGRKYECFIEDHEAKPWWPGQCADYAGRSLHLMRCTRKDGFGPGALFCRQHAAIIEREMSKP
jgi:hypothetical protein